MEEKRKDAARKALRKALQKPDAYAASGGAHRVRSTKTQSRSTDGTPTATSSVLSRQTDRSNPNYKGKMQTQVRKQKGDKNTSTSISWDQESPMRVPGGGYLPSPAASQTTTNGKTTNWKRKK